MAPLPLSLSPLASRMGGATISSGGYEDEEGDADPRVDVEEGLVDRGEAPAAHEGVLVDEQRRGVDDRDAVGRPSVEREPHAARRAR